MTPDLRRTLGLLALVLLVVLGGIWLLRRASGPAPRTRSAATDEVAGTEQEALAALRARLVELRVAQDTFHRHYGIYGRSVGQMRFAVPAGMTIEIIGHSTSGWAAQASVGRSDALCAIFVGDSAQWVFPPAVTSGVPACTR